jgi:hypothetical protein
VSQIKIPIPKSMMDRQEQGEAMRVAAEDKTGLMALLPDDVLRGHPPRGLAVSRCVCKSWLAVVDARRLLRMDLLPLSLGGFFMNFNNYYISKFLAPILDGPSISIKHDYLPKAGSHSVGYVDDRSNGLVLVVRRYDDNGDRIRYVLNSVTRWLVP